MEISIRGFYVFIVFFVAATPVPTEALIDDVLDVIHVVKEVTTGILKAWDIVQQSPIASTIELPLMREKQKKVLSRLKEVSRHIDQTQEKYGENVALAIQSINHFAANDVQLLGKTNQISNTLYHISSRFKKMQQYEQYQEKLETQTLIKFAEWTVAPNTDSVHYLMERLHLMLFGPEEKENITISTFALLAKSYEQSTEQICETKQSPQQFIYSLYTDIALTELKGYTMMEFSWMMLRVYGKGNFTEEAGLMRTDYKRRTERTLQYLRQVMRRADRILWRCDPVQFVKGETYDEVTRLLQGYIENEVDLNGDETCRETCDYYTSTRSQSCFKDKFCKNQPRCSGKLYDCKFVDSDMWICQADKMSNRRYEYIEYENGRILGKKNSCRRGTNKVDSWWRYLFWHCSYCFCLCDESSGKSDRYFNLRATIADVSNNKIVTGLRLVKVNRVFHLQIEEGQLLPRGNVNISTLSWRPVDDYNVFDRTVIDGRDYHTLSYEKRAIDLDDIHAEDKSFVVAGVRFRLIGSHLNLEAYFCEFNFDTGNLVISREAPCVWHSNDNTEGSPDKRIKITLRDPDMSTNTLLKSIPDSTTNQYINFAQSSLDKDASQSTVPFIDTQSVSSRPPVPLSGIGIYHKGQPGYGGFIAPKIITYDFTNHVHLPVDAA